MKWQLELRVSEGGADKDSSARGENKSFLVSFLIIIHFHLGSVKYLSWMLFYPQHLLQKICGHIEEFKELDSDYQNMCGR